MPITLDTSGDGYELDCGCFVCIEPGSLAISERTNGPLIDKWPFMLLVDCPYCGDSYCWARPLAAR